MPSVDVDIIVGGGAVRYKHYIHLVAMLPLGAVGLLASKAGAAAM